MPSGALRWITEQATQDSTVCASNSRACRVGVGGPAAMASGVTHSVQRPRSCNARSYSPQLLTQYGAFGNWCRCVWWT